MTTLESIVQEEVEWMFGDAEEVGSSDVYACMQNVLNTAQSCGVVQTDSSFQQIIISGMIREELSNMEQSA